MATASGPAFDLETARLLRLVAADLSDGLPEAPDMAFRIACRIDAVAVKLVRGLADDDGARGARPSAMRVDAVLQLDMNHLRIPAADTRGTADIVGPLRADHDVAVAEAHLGMSESSL